MIKWYELVDPVDVDLFLNDFLNLFLVAFDRILLLIKLLFEEFHPIFHGVKLFIDLLQLVLLSRG